uniref:Uncharacterized protein n=1 Tax=Octopus bimaculoides TaxID=37653 RepID=A0A0L8HMX8_OCTBM
MSVSFWYCFSNGYRAFPSYYNLIFRCRFRRRFNQQHENILSSFHTKFKCVGAHF